MRKGQGMWVLLSLTIVCARAWSLAGEPGNESPGKILPKIRIADTGRHFVTDAATPFVPFGINYYRPGTGWAPQVWKQFDPQATRRDFARLKELGGNCVRVFLSFGSFYPERGTVSEEAMRKLDQFLAIAEEAGIYVHPTGPDMWEGHPQWVSHDRYADEQMLQALETFWKILAARYKDRGVIFAYDLLNEPMVPWNTPQMQARWQRWVIDRYGSVQKAAEAWKIPGDAFASGTIPVPAAEDKPNDLMLLDYQRCREGVADEWTRRQAQAIKSVDPNALVTVGFIQWSVPAVLPKADLYAAFRPERQAKYLDFLEVHFYPLEHGAYEYGNIEQEQRNLAYLEAVVREVAKPGKPVVLAEFGWHGGGSFPMGQRQSKPGTQEDQARWCSLVVETTAPFAAGWLNWGFYDHPQAKDVSVWTGLLTVDGQEKAWGRRFRELAGKYARHVPLTSAVGARPDLPWDSCITSPQSANQFREHYIKAFLADRPEPQPQK